MEKNKLIDKLENFILNYWSGKEKLWKAFWLIGIVGRIFVAFFIIIFSLIGKDDYDKLSLLLVLIILFIQILLGILTLLYVVPLSLAILHQTNATFLLASMLFSYHRLIYK